MPNLNLKILNNNKEREILKILEKKPELIQVLINVENYMEKEYGEKLAYNPIKSKDQFLKNYKIHDIASKYILDLFSDKGYYTFILGKDLRNKRVQMTNEIPDILILTNDWLISFDVKSKTNIKWFGIVNERASLGYKKFQKVVSTNKYIIPIYSQFVLVENDEPKNQLGYSNLSEVYLEKRRMWDGNIVYKYNWKKGLLI